MLDCHVPLISPVAKLDIKDLIDETASSPPGTALSSTFSRSSSLASPQTQYSHTSSSSSSAASSSLSHYAATTAAPNHFTSHPTHPIQQLPQQQPPPPLSNTAQAVFQQNPGLNPAAASTKRPAPNGSRHSGSPKRSKGKWTPEEDAKIIVLRGRGMKWDDISLEIPDRSPISCRLHYQNYLEKRADWDEEQRNKLARVYDRLKPELWNPIATELGMPWRACEAMHWALGEADMCRRANVVPFPLSTNRGEPACAPAPSAGRVAQRDRMRGSTRVFEGHDITTITSSSSSSSSSATSASGFNSINGHSNNGTPQSHVSYPVATAAATVVPPMNLPGIGNGQSFPGYDEAASPADLHHHGFDEACNSDSLHQRQQKQHHQHQQQQVKLQQLQQLQLQLQQHPQHEAPPARLGRLGSGTRLPGLAELDRTIGADFAADFAAGGRMMIKQEEQMGGRLVIKQEEQMLQQQQQQQHGTGPGRVKLEHERRGSSGSGIMNSRRSR